MKSLSSFNLGLSILSLCTALATAAESNDPILFTFATVGDSRADAANPELSAHDKIWLQNTKVLSRMIREIQERRPDALFFNGDMIMGYTTNTNVLNRQYAYWRGMVSALLETGTYVVPVPGNHEMQVKLPGLNKEADPIKIAQRECENNWRENMGDLILDTNLWEQLSKKKIYAWNAEHAPQCGSADPIQSDQRQLTFSFDCAQVHIAVINTDAFGNDSHAPVHWLANDLGRARARGCQRSFVFGHKMAFSYHFGAKTKAKGLDADPDHAAAFWKVIADFDATYFCGHEHIYHSSQPDFSGNTHPWQIIVGSGGSPFDAKPGDSANVNDRKYVWALVHVYRSGRVVLESYGFDEQFAPTELIEKIELHDRILGTTGK
jgi:hypothetical protein